MLAVLQSHNRLLLALKALAKVSRGRGNGSAPAARPWRIQAAPFSGVCGIAPPT
jgi:hypothetical protein